MLAMRTFIPHSRGALSPISRRSLATKRRREIPPAITLSQNYKQVFHSLVDWKKNDEKVTISEGKQSAKTAGIILRYEQSSDSLSMAFTFDFVKRNEISKIFDEVLVVEPQLESNNDDDERLFVVHRSAIMKTLGGTVHVEEEDGFTPFIVDKHGDRINPAD